MDNNDFLVRFRYSLDLKDTEMIEIFKLGNIKLKRDELLKILERDEEKRTNCNYHMLESFLNGFIIYKRGVKEDSGAPTKPIFLISDVSNVNNIILKKLKIALSYSSENMIEILNLAGVNISNGELSALFRKEGHRNYRVCGDSYIRNFLKGLAIKYRKD